LSDFQQPAEGFRPAPPAGGDFAPRPPGPFGGPGGPGMGPPGMGGPPRPGGGGFRGRPKGKYTPRRKVCQFCVDKISHIDYKDLMRLRRFLSDRAKIEPRRKTGTCAKHQRRLSMALKRARMIALLPFTGEHLRQMGGMIQPVPGMPSVPDRPYPPRDSFGPGGSQPGGMRPPERQDGPPPADGQTAPAPTATAEAAPAAPAAEPAAPAEAAPAAPVEAAPAEAASAEPEPAGATTEGSATT
jgi:small subunit ribosomal protein S18